MNLLLYETCFNPKINRFTEAGLCAVIPCSFKSGFEAEVIIWYKCDQPVERCKNSDIIFHSDKNNVNVQSGFKGRVSLLEPDVTQKKCSIMINDLRPSDSGYYQLRIAEYSGLIKQHFHFKFIHLNQKPKVTIPPLNEGQQATLTCTAPGLCSGHSSTLTFNPSAEHHNSKITCKVSFTGDKTTEKTATLNVTLEYSKITLNVVKVGKKHPPGERKLIHGQSKMTHGRQQHFLS
uniref:B-cell receptor CD22 first Ig-like domain-containing protein n=1 Tax=Fundulus heteroclitus TaxID=8078 RepID=A0A3Q2QE02_FUNHE